MKYKEILANKLAQLEMDSIISHSVWETLIQHHKDYMVALGIKPDQMNLLVNLASYRGKTLNVKLGERSAKLYNVLLPSILVGHDEIVLAVKISSAPPPRSESASVFMAFCVSKESQNQHVHRKSDITIDFTYLTEGCHVDLVKHLTHADVVEDSELL